MYNTQFKVKYNDIEVELLNKLKEKSTEEYLENSDEEYEYSSDDIIDVCNKLYRDEFLSVFGAESFIDDKIDKGMKYVYNIVMTNDKFKEILNEISNLISKQILRNEEIKTEEQDEFRLIILISLFRQQLFHITHKCVCQAIESGTIDDELLVELRKQTADLLNNNSDVN